MKQLLTIIDVQEPEGRFLRKFIGYNCYTCRPLLNLSTIVQLVDPNTGLDIPYGLYWKDNFIYEQQEDKEYLAILNNL